MARSGGAAADFFLKSKPGTVWNDVFEEKMEPNDFIDIHEGLERLWEEHHMGFFMAVETMYNTIVRCTHPFVKQHYRCVKQLIP